MDAFLGTILTVGFNYAPSGWATSSGQLLNISQNSALFALFGTYYGGNGVSTFGLPNLSGRAPIGTGQGAGLHTNYVIGQTAGTDTTTLTLPNMPMHTHVANVQWQQGSQQVTIPATTGDLNVAVTMNATSSPGSSLSPSPTANMLSGNTAARVYGATTTSNLVPLGGTTVAVTGTASTAATNVTIQTLTGGTVTNAPTGGSQPFSTQSPSLALTFIVALNGIFPSRP